MNYLSLFSGIGGFELGLLQAGFKFKWHGYNEIDKYAKQIYKKHFPDAEDLGDVKGIEIYTNNHLRETTSISTATGNVCNTGHINLITFGFPCQDLSIAGKRGGITASRSTLFFEAMQIIGDAKPDYFIFENVKGLFSSNGGKDWLVVLREIANAGYDGQWQLLNTRWFLPQNRERIYFIGHIRGRSKPKVFPIGEGSQDTSKSTGEREAGVRDAVGIDSSYYKGADGKRTMIQVGFIKDNAEAHRVYSPDGCARTIKDGGGMGAKTGLYEIQTAQPRCGDSKKGGTGPLRSTEYSFTVDSQPHIVNRIRRLTPTECERLQGFPDDWTKGISDTQRYKTLGNAVSVPVVQAIGVKLLS